MLSYCTLARERLWVYVRHTPISQSDGRSIRLTIVDMSGNESMNDAELATWESTVMPPEYQTVTLLYTLGSQARLRIEMIYSGIFLTDTSSRIVDIPPRGNDRWKGQVANYSAFLGLVHRRAENKPPWLTTS